MVIHLSLSHGHIALPLGHYPDIDTLPFPAIPCYPPHSKRLND